MHKLKRNEVFQNQFFVKKNSLQLLDLQESMFYLVFVILIFYSHASGNTDTHQRKIRQNGQNSDANSCTTPDNQSGICVNVRQCSYLNNILKSMQALEPENMTYLQKSFCGKDTNQLPKVCCNPNIKTESLLPTQSHSGTDSCTTPNNQPGTCISIRQCPHLNDILKSLRALEPENMSFLQKSFCGKDMGNRPKVCCNHPAVETPSVDSSMVRFDALPRSTTTTTHTPTTQHTNNDEYENNEDQDYSVCGKSNRNADKMVEEYNSTLGDWPWVVALGYHQGANRTTLWHCGGSIISDKWVITAAHCVQNMGNLTLTTVRIGDIHLNDAVIDGATRWNFAIEKIIIHSEYSNNPIANDIALIRLKHRINFTKNVRPICISSKEEHKNDEFYVDKIQFIAGWGSTPKKASKSEMLQEAQVNMIDRDTCSEAHRFEGSEKPIDTQMLCASCTEENGCQADSGGPLMMPIGSDYYLMGITAYGDGCGSDELPEVYTKVAYFSDWIRTKTGIKM